MQCACDTSDKDNIRFCPTHARIAELEAELRALLDERHRGASGRIIVDRGQEAHLRRLVGL